MPDESTRNWSTTYIGVLLIEALIICGLWLFSRHFSS
jgi:hypothetical protein